MEQSLLAAVSGIQANQTALDAIGNNIANSNTIGYKQADALFTDLLAEQIAGATAPNGASAGINPISVGAGVRIGAILTSETQGAIQQTNQPTDVAIEGDGFFVVNHGGQQMFTRAGAFLLDADGNLSTPSGALVQGWTANAAGVINNNAPIGAIRIDTGAQSPPAASTEITLGGNLPAWDGAGTQPVATTTINAYDSLGNAVPVTLTFTGVAGSPNQWSVQGTVPNPPGAPTSLWTTPPTVTFDPTDGQVTSVTGVAANPDGSFALPVNTMPTNFTFPAGDIWKVNFPAPGSSGAVTQFAGNQTLAAVSQDGKATGQLESFTIGADGTLIGVYSNGSALPIAQLATATFTNSQGLQNKGNSEFSQSANSGIARIGVPGTGGRGGLIGGALESSNVNLANQLTNLIQTQENYQANTKVITSTNQALQSLMNMP